MCSPIFFCLRTIRIVFLWVYTNKKLKQMLEL